MADLSLKSGYLRLNDIELRVPPESISIIKNDFNNSVATLRSPTSTQIKTGRRTISIIIDTYFASGYDANSQAEVDSTSWVNEQLVPLIIQIRKFPFISIENEKIRKEVLGDFLRETSNGAKEINMAAIVKQVDVSANAKEPEFFNLRLHLEWFNYSPYSVDFKYKEMRRDGTSLPSDLPSNEFNKFIRSGTVMAPKIEGAPAVFTNSLNLDAGQDLEIIYKEYQRVDIEPLKFKEEYEALLNFDIDTTEEILPPLRAKNSQYEESLEGLKQKGWILLDDSQAAEQEPGRIFYRYRKFVVKSIDPKSIIESGRLIVESAAISLQTRTPSIPLLGHTVPTSQFLGAADAIISIGMFANAELENQKAEGKPIGTSGELAKLNSIIELINRNAVIYRRLSKNDAIFIKHPLVKLLKYKPYDEKDLQYVEIDGQGNEVVNFFNLDEYLACTVNSTESATVPGLPYCSRFNLVVTENYRSLLSNIKQASSGPSNRVYESTKNLVNKLAKKFLIVKEGNTFIFSDEAPVEDPDFAPAQKLLRYLQDSLILKPGAATAEAIINDSFFIEKRTRDIDKEARQIDEGIKPMSSDRLNEVASDLISIAARSQPTDQKFLTYQEDLEEFKGFNLSPLENNYPDMLLPSANLQPDFFFFNQSDQANNRIKRDVLSSVHERYRQSAEQFAENIGNKDAAKKISPDLMGSDGPPLAAPNLITVGEEKERRSKTEMDKAFTQAPLDLSQQFSNIQTAVDNFSDNTYSMRRSMPTFKLYVKDGDIGSLSDVDKDRIHTKAGSGIWRNFTDFYDINGIVDIRLVKDKENPADILVIRMTNAKEDIVNKSFEDRTSLLERQKRLLQKTKPEDGDTEGRSTRSNLTDLDGIMLKEGTRIELRLGYENNPNFLSIEFSGRISQVGGGDIVEIVCQGDGVELIQELKGVGTPSEEAGEQYTWSSNTPNLISDLLHNSPEVSSFGTIDAKGDLGNVPFLWQSAGGRTVVENVFAPPLFGTWDGFKGKTINYGINSAAFFGVISGGALALPAGAIGAGIGLIADAVDVVRTFFKGSRFTIYEQTIWEVLQEMTYRHPGTICSVVPYDRRSTIFFGYPEQLYFHRGPDYLESAVLRGNNDNNSIPLVGAEKTGAEFLISKGGGLALVGATSKQEVRESSTNADSPLLFNAISEDDSNTLIYESNDAGKLTDIRKVKSGEIYLGLMKQFRNYHMITSEHDIIENNMAVSSDGVYNSIQIVFPKVSKEGNFDGSVGFSEYKKSDEIRGDDDLNRDYIKRQTLVFHNAHQDIENIDLPQKYAISNLCNSLNNVYRGKIKILGRPGIKPHDIVFIYDNYNNIYGAVEVKSIIHIFSYDTGWITEIVPQMIVTPSTSTSIIHVNSMKRLAHSFYLRNSKLFHNGLIFNDVEGLSSIDEDESTVLADAAKASLTGTAFGTSTLLAERAVLDGAGKVRAGKKLLAAKDISKIGLLAKGGKFALGRLVGSSLPIIGSLGIDYLHGYYANWSKYRQPIVFMPVTRNGKPWYTALHGFNNNTEIDAVKSQAKDIYDKGKYFVELFREEFPEVFN